MAEDEKNEYVIISCSSQGSRSNPIQLRYLADGDEIILLVKNLIGSGNVMIPFIADSTHGYHLNSEAVGQIQFLQSFAFPLPDSKLFNRH